MLHLPPISKVSSISNDARSPDARLNTIVVMCGRRTRVFSLPQQSVTVEVRSAVSRVPMQSSARTLKRHRWRLRRGDHTSYTVATVVHLAGATPVQCRIHYAFAMVQRGLANVENIRITLPGGTVARVPAHELWLGANRVPGGQRAITSFGGKRTVAAAIDIGRHQNGSGRMAQVEALTVVRVGKDAQRRARKVALVAERMAGTGFVGATTPVQVAVEAQRGVTHLDGKRMPLATNFDTSGQQFAGVADQTAAGSLLTQLRLPWRNRVFKAITGTSRSRKKCLQEIRETEMVYSNQKCGERY